MLERFAFSTALDVMAAVDADVAFHEAVPEVVPESHTVQIWHRIAPRVRGYCRRESLVGTAVFLRVTHQAG